MDRPIGVFDSGVGGLTVARQIYRHLPNESVVYFGDTARIPYGSKSLSTLRRFAHDGASFLISQDVKALVVACNTIASVCLDELQQVLDIPVVGVVEPAARAAVAASQSKRIGLIGTRATIESDVYPRAIKKLDPEAKVFVAACPLFVPLIEEGWVDNEVTYQVITRYLSEMRQLSPDVLLLGCSHYPLMAPAIQRWMGEGVTLVESGEATVAELARMLADIGMLRSSPQPPTRRFFVSDLSTNFKNVAAAYLDGRLGDVEEIEVEKIGTLALLWGESPEPEL